MKSGVPDLKIIINGCIQGDGECQKLLFDRLFGKMLAVCYRYGNNEDEAKDMAQEGMIKVFNKLNKYTYNGSFDGWARRIVVNNAIDTIRKKHQTFVEINEDKSLGEYDSYIEEEKDSKYEGVNEKLIMQEIQNLPISYRSVFNLYVIENYKHHEVAEILGISEGTSKSNLAKAKSKLKDALSKHLKKNYV